VYIYMSAASTFAVSSAAALTQTARFCHDATVKLLIRQSITGGIGESSLLRCNRSGIRDDL
jgi:hypothetical protein